MNENGKDSQNLDYRDERIIGLEKTQSNNPKIQQIPIQTKKDEEQTRTN